MISEKHEEVQESHAEAAEDVNVDSFHLSQFMVEDFIQMKNELAAEQVTRGEVVGGEKTADKAKGKAAGQGARAEARVRTIQGNIFAQLALAFMNRSDHYHHAHLFDIKLHQVWMPAYQGVSTFITKIGNQDAEATITDDYGVCN